MRRCRARIDSSDSRVDLHSLSLAEVAVDDYSRATSALRCFHPSAGRNSIDSDGGGIIREEREEERPYGEGRRRRQRSRLRRRWYQRTKEEKDGDVESCVHVVTRQRQRHTAPNQCAPSSSPSRGGSSSSSSSCSSHRRCF